VSPYSLEFLTQLIGQQEAQRLEFKSSQDLLDESSKRDNFIKHQVVPPNKQAIVAVSGAVLLALTIMASAGPMSFASSKLVAPPQAQAEPLHYRCQGYYGWVPDGTIAGPTGGYPYFGWCGYPLVRYRYCGRPYHRHYGHYRRPCCQLGYCRRLAPSSLRY
jgi:hypothetical protein